MHTRDALGRVGAQRDAVAVVVQRRETDHPRLATRHLEQFGQGAEGPWW